MRIHLHAGCVTPRPRRADPPHRIATAAAGAVLAALMVFSFGGTTASAKHDGEQGKSSAKVHGHDKGGKDHGGQDQGGQDQGGGGSDAQGGGTEQTSGSGKHHRSKGGHGHHGHGGSAKAPKHSARGMQPQLGAGSGSAAAPALSPALVAGGAPAAAGGAQGSALTPGTGAGAAGSGAAPARSAPGGGALAGGALQGSAGGSARRGPRGTGGSGSARGTPLTGRPAQRGGEPARPTPPVTVIPVLGLPPNLPGLSPTGVGIPLWVMVLGSLAVLVVVAGVSVRGARAGRRGR